MDLHSGLPYWVVKNSLLDYFHPLEDDFSTDIVVVCRFWAAILDTNHRTAKLQGKSNSFMNSTRL